MKSTGGTDEQKRRAGESAAAVVEEGTTVGLGTGSTAAHAIRALGRRVEDGLDIRGIPTSYQSRALAIECKIPLCALDSHTVDLAIDGADQFAGGDLLKGGGAAHTREKVIATAAAEVRIVADASKRRDRLDGPVALEVLPDARPVVAATVRTLGGEPRPRAASRKDGPVVTDNGNLVLDCAFGEIDQPAALAADLSAVPGVVEHGLFCGVADAIHVGTDDGVEERVVTGASASKKP